MQSESPIRHSVVVPFFDEQENIPGLYMRICEVMDSIGDRYEIVFVDDGSSDHSYRVLSEIYEHDQRVHVVRLRRSFGRTPALKAGFDLSCGDIVIWLNGDLRDDPEEIPRFLEKIEEGFDLVSAWSPARGSYTSRLSKRMTNWLMEKISGIELHDFQSTYVACRCEILEEVCSSGGLHRSYIALAASRGGRIAELALDRDEKKAEFNAAAVNRKSRGTIGVIAELIIIRFLSHHSTRQTRFFGLAGLAALVLSCFVALFLLVQKFYSQRNVFSEHGPLAYLVVALFVAGVQFVAIELWGEIIARAYYKPENRPIYTLRDVKSHAKDAADSAGRRRGSND